MNAATPTSNWASVWLDRVLDGVARSADGWSDRLNPVIVKECRHLLKGWSFGVSFVFLLGLMWWLTLFGLAGATTLFSVDDTGLSRQLFQSQMAVLLLALLFPAPFSAFDLMNAEYTESKHELLVATTLTSWGIVRGKLFSVLLQCALCYITVLPYFMLCYAIGGISITEFTTTLAVAAMACAAINSVAILLGTFTGTMLGRVFTLILLLFLAILTYGSVPSIVSDTATTTFGDALGLRGFSMAVATCGLFLAVTLTSLLGAAMRLTVAKPQDRLLRLREKRLAQLRSDGAPAAPVVWTDPTPAPAARPAARAKEVAEKPRTSLLEAPGWIGRSARWTDRVSDHVNPILVKELRQALNGKHFLTSYLLLILGLWILTAWFVADLQGRTEYLDVGGRLFHRQFLILTGIVFVVVPLAAFESMNSEFGEAQHELLVASPLSAKGIVFGKLQSVMLQVVLLFSAVAPFWCMSYLLGGISLVTVAFAILATFLAAATLYEFALMLGAVSQSVGARLFSILVLVGGSLVVCSIGFGMSSAMVSGVGGGWESWGQLLAGFLCMTYLFLMASVFFLGVSVEKLTVVKPYMRPKRPVSAASRKVVLPPGGATEGGAGPAAATAPP